MGIVKFALRFPHSFYVLAAFILFIGVTAIRVMPADIFPEINIPVVTIIWEYDGLSTPEMEQRVTIYSQYAISANVSGIKDMEAQTLNGLSVLKIYFQPDVSIDLAIAQIVSASNAIRRFMPPGIQPPIVVQYNASSVPVLQLSLTSETLDQAQLYDYGIYSLRQQLAPVQGVTFPTPDGGKPRQIMVDIDPKKLLAKGLTPNDVVNAVNAQSLTLPSGLIKIGNIQYTVRTNSMAPSIAVLNDIPIKYVNGQTVFVRDVGQVRDGWAVQQNSVRENGKEAVLLSVIKNGNASTVTVVKGVLAALQIAREAAPSGLSINELFDQSKFVSSAIEDVIQEGLIAAGLTALMILLFLGSWRSTLVVMISIPLAILSSIIGLYLTGNTLNTMTLGGLALAVGILVDDSTVTIENTHRILEEEGKPLPEATLYGSAGIAVPTLVSTLSISCVFASVIFLEGPPKYLFAPLGLAVVLAMLASYALSRTLTPITIGLLLRSELSHEAEGAAQGPFARFHAGFERRFEHMRQGYVQLLGVLLARRTIVPIVVALLIGLGAVLYMFVGRDFYPVVDAGQIKLHVRAPAATRLEETVKIFHAVEQKIREVIPKDAAHLGRRRYRRPGERLQPCLHRRLDHRLKRRRDPHLAERRPRADRRLRQDAARGAARYLPQRDLLFSGRRHGDADPQLRSAGADRRAHRRPRRQDEPAHRPRAAPAHGRHPGHRRRPPPAGGGRAGLLHDDRPLARAAGRAQRGIDCEQRQHQSELVQAGQSQLLDRSEVGHPLLFRGADAAVLGEHAWANCRTRRSPPASRSTTPTRPASPSRA